MFVWTPLAMLSLVRVGFTEVVVRLLKCGHPGIPHTSCKALVNGEMPYTARNTLSASAADGRYLAAARVPNPESGFG
jgi:hypothetical protein